MTRARNSIESFRACGENPDVEAPHAAIEMSRAIVFHTTSATEPSGAANAGEVIDAHEQ